MSLEEELALYKTLYHKQFNANEDAMRILEQAQQACEELYLKATEHQPPADDDTD